MSAAAPDTRRVFARFVEGFLSPLRSEMEDESVSEILVNGPSEVFVERRGKLQRSAATFASEAELMRALCAVAQILGRSFDETHPILEGRLPDGSRLQAVMAPVSEVGPCVAIRRHRHEQLSLGQLIEWGALNDAAAHLLRQAVLEKRNIIVSGGTGSGKTSLLRCVASLTPMDERIVTIEDAKELHLKHEHVVAFESFPGDARGKGRVSIRDLFVATLRLRPDRIVIGELRGGESLDLIQAMTSGHGGCLSTVHASSPLDALRRIETLALFSGVELPLLALRSQVASAVDLIVQVERAVTGERYVRTLSEVMPLDAAGSYAVRTLLDRPKGASELLAPRPGAADER